MHRPLFGAIALLRRAGGFAAHALSRSIILRATDIKYAVL